MKPESIRALVGSIGCTVATSFYGGDIYDICEENSLWIFICHKRSTFINYVKNAENIDERNPADVEYLNMIDESIHFAFCGMGNSFMEGAIVLIEEDLPKEVFSHDMIRAIIFHELGHLVLNTQDEEKADLFAIEHCGIDNVRAALNATKRQYIKTHHGHWYGWGRGYSHRYKLLK